MTYEAFWIPGLDTDFGRDEGLALGEQWLRDSLYPGRRLIVLYAANMIQNAAPLANMATRYPVVSPRTRNHPGRGGHAVLAVWTSEDALDFAEELASPGGGLCLIPGTFGEASMWVSRARAVNLADPEAGPAEGLSLDHEVTNALDSMLAFDGHNRFRGAGGKEDAIRRLRQMVAQGHRPPPVKVEAYAVASGETDHGGASHLRELYEGVLAGKQFRDYRGHLIR
jgi:hypothetical protein